MRKKIICMFMALLMIIPPSFLITSCGDDKEAAETEIASEVTSETLTSEQADSENVGYVLEKKADDSVAFLGNYFEQPSPDYLKYRMPKIAKGIYLTANTAGINEYLAPKLEICDSTEINAVVIDIKEDYGFITFKNKIKMADELEVSTNAIQDIDSLLKELKDKNIYTIARMVVFKDNAIIKTHPEYAIGVTDGSNGGVYRQKEKPGWKAHPGYGTAWLNPYNKDVWKYTTDLAIEVAKLGFDEIQFDYIRFPTDANVKNADFGETGGLSRIEIVNEFSKYAVERLRPYGVYVSADIFGTIITSDLDASLIGQDFVGMSSIFDIVCPMVYPSHYASGALGVEFPDLEPYEILYRSMSKAQEKLDTIPEGEHRAIVRPWLQDFTAPYVTPHQEYGAKQVREQIQGTYDAGFSEWLIWNASNKYSVGGFLPE